MLDNNWQAKDINKVEVVQMGIKAVEKFNTDFELDSVVRNCLLSKFTLCLQKHFLL